MTNLIIRPYLNSDCEAVSKLFYETVHSVNAKDYTQEQLFAWVNDEKRLLLRRNDLLLQKTLIAELNRETVGFVSIDKFGCLDLLFVHKDFQRKGIATALCNEVERGFKTVTTYASITAKPFFEKRGYTVLKEQEVERFGIKLKNFEMQINNSSSKKPR